MYIYSIWMDFSAITWRIEGVKTLLSRSFNGTSHKTLNATGRCIEKSGVTI